MASYESQRSGHDEHNEPVLTQPNPEVIARGHEADGYDPASVWSVPLLVVLFFVLAFVTTTILFYYLAPQPPSPDTHPLAAERNKAPLEERLARITRGGEVDQPRLEPLRIRTGDARAITRPEAPVGNSPEIHPEDLRPSPTTTPDLYRRGWLDTNKTVARVTIDEAMRLSLERNLLPVRKEAVVPLRSTQLPSSANAGRSRIGGEASPGEHPNGTPVPPARTQETSDKKPTTPSSGEKPKGTDRVPEPPLPQAPAPRPNQ
jgi:hypothetical protein